MEIIRLRAEDYDELLTVLNRTFTVAHHGVPMDFEKSLPKMCKRTDEHMGKHFGLRCDGKLKAVLGVYPLPVRMAGEELLFSTMGNVATLPEETGKGYMSMLLDAAMQELNRIGADASRLGGKRSRYRRYGFDPAGSLCHYVLDLDQWPQRILPEPVTFVPMKRQDEELLEQARQIHQAGDFAVIRANTDEFYDTLIAWENVPYAAFSVKGELLGYLSASADGAAIAELECRSLEAFQSIVYGWLSQKAARTSIPLMPHRLEENFFLADFCISSSVSAPCHFKVIHWEKVIHAALKLRASYTYFPKFEKLIEVQGYGKLLVRTDGVFSECHLVQDEQLKPDISIPWYRAQLLFFGQTTMLPDLMGCGGVLPLPLSWNLQDRV